MKTNTRANRKGGAVAHIMRDASVSVCGRIMAYVPGGEGLRLCKTCTRITGVAMDIDTRAFPEIPELSSLPALAPEWEAIEREWMRNADSFTMGNARDVLTQYMNNPSEYDLTDAHTVRLLAKYRAYLKLHTGADFLDPTDTVAPSLNRGGGDGMVNRNSKSVAKSRGATANQRGALLRMAAFADSLFSQLLAAQGKEDTHPNAMVQRYSDEFFDGLTTRASIDKEFTSTSALIDRLKIELEKAKQEARKNAPATATRTVAQDGYYVHGDTFVCVKWNRAKTGQYATVWDGSGWEYDGSESRKLVADVKAGKLALMTPEDAKRFGDLYGVCFKCSRTLTDPESIAQGYGPVCAGKMGW